MKNGAMMAYVSVECDTPAFASPTYMARFVDDSRDDALKWDNHGIIEDSETYNMYVKVPKSEKDLMLDWSRDETAADFSMALATGSTPPPTR
ncbi:MAG: hypothetical protein IKP00_16845 [Victivallales bacterium]|nr:hypothetical protein [Victivallales bacterium]